MCLPERIEEALLAQALVCIPITKLLESCFPQQPAMSLWLKVPLGQWPSGFSCFPYRSICRVHDYYGRACQPTKANRQLHRPPHFFSEKCQLSPLAEPGKNNDSVQGPSLQNTSIPDSISPYKIKYVCGSQPLREQSICPHTPGLPPFNSFFKL